VEKPGQDREISKRPLTRSEFLRLCGRGFCAFSLSCLLGLPGTVHAQPVKKGLIKTKLSPWYTRLDGSEIRCELCPLRCRVGEGKRGYCRVRENRKGKLYSLVYGNLCVLDFVPIERIPFFHVLPSTTCFSIATVGCNFNCKCCQAWALSQASPEDVYSYDVPPEAVIAKAGEMGARSVAYSYVEPAVFYEYAMDTSHLVNKSGLLNLMHSNGFINRLPLESLGKTLDAANIDLKGFSDVFYKELSGGYLTPVLETMKTLKSLGVHLEITNLIIPTKNDDISVIGEMCRWIKGELGPETPIHFSRFYPLYKLTGLPPTPISSLEKARAAAMAEGLEYVYIGNIPGHEGENTFCPKCGKMIIRRAGYMVVEINMKEGKCKYCGKPIPGIWS